MTDWWRSPSQPPYEEGFKLQPPLFRSGLEVGQRVFIEHPEMEEAVGGIVKGEIPQAGILVVELDATQALVHVPLDMIRPAKEGDTNWRALTEEGPFWKQHDFAIVPTGVGRNRFYEVYSFGEAWRNFPRLEEAKGAVEREFGPQVWVPTIVPKVVVDHYYFGETDEFSAPSRVYVADL